MDKILVVFDKSVSGVAGIINENPYERTSFESRIFAHLIVYVSKKNQEVTILKNRSGYLNDPNIISFFKNLYGIINPSPEESKEPEDPVDRFKLMDFEL